MTSHTLAGVGLAVLSPGVVALGVAYVRTTLAGGRRDGGGAGLLLLSVAAVLAVLALVVAPVLRELAVTVDTLTTGQGTP